MLRSITLICVTLLQLLQLSNSWMQFPYGNNEFNHDVEYGANVTITCEDDRVPLTATFRYWIRPDLTIMKSGESESYWTLDGSASWMVNVNGDLKATLLNERQFGFYYCILEDTEDNTHVIKKGINYRGPYFGNQWEKYRTNVIVGLTAAGVFVVLVIIYALLATFCCPPSQNYAKPAAKQSMSNGGTQMSDAGPAEKKNIYENEMEFHEVRL